MKVPDIINALSLKRKLMLLSVLSSTLGLLVAGVFFLFNRWLRIESNRRRWHAFLLRMPLVGKVVRGSNTARFARTLSTLTASTVPVLEALRISSEVVTNLPMKAAVEDAAVRVREGAPIGRSLGTSRVFPPMMIHLISSGETSGELDTMLERAAVHQERELDSILHNIAKVSEVASDDVPATSHPIPINNVTRPDEIADVLTLEEVLANAPEAADGMFRVSSILGEEQ